MCTSHCVCVCVRSYCLIGDNGRLQYLKFHLLKCMLICFLSYLFNAVSLTLVRG